MRTLVLFIRHNKPKCGSESAFGLFWRDLNFRSIDAPSRRQSTNEKIKNLILAGEHDKLIKYENLGCDVALATPSAEHYLRLLYALALKDESEPLEIFNDRIHLGSISMPSVKIG